MQVIRFVSSDSALFRGIRAGGRWEICLSVRISPRSSPWRRSQTPPVSGLVSAPRAGSSGRGLAVGTSSRPMCEQPMRLSLCLLIVAALIAVCSGAPPSLAAGPGQPDVEALLQHLDDLYRSKSSIARMEIDVTSPRSTRSMRLKAWTRGEDEVLVLIEAPPREAGHGDAARRQQPLELPAQDRPHDSRAARGDARVLDGHRLHQRRSGEGIVAAQGLRRAESIGGRTRRRAGGSRSTSSRASSAAGRASRSSSPTSGCRSRSGTSIARAASRGRCGSTR